MFVQVRGCTITDTPSSTLKNTISVVGGPLSFGLGKKSKDSTEEPLKSESQEKDHHYGNFSSSKLSEVIDKILHGKFSKVPAYVFLLLEYIYIYIYLF